MLFQTVSPLFAAGEVLLGLSITMFVGVSNHDCEPER